MHVSQHGRNTVLSPKHSVVSCVWGRLINVSDLNVVIIGGPPVFLMGDQTVPVSCGQSNTVARLTTRAFLRAYGYFFSSISLSVSLWCVYNLIYISAWSIASVRDNAANNGTRESFIAHLAILAIRLPWQRGSCSRWNLRFLPKTLSQMPRDLLANLVVKVSASSVRSLHSVKDCESVLALSQPGKDSH